MKPITSTLPRRLWALLPIPLRIAAGALALFASNSVVMAAAPAQPEAKPSPTDLPEPFNPARCEHGDKKYVYWAAGDQVFRFKFDPMVPLRSTAESELTGVRLNAKRDVPAAPDPTEVEGCFGNPMRAGAVPYMDQYSAALFKSVVGRKLKSNNAILRGFMAVPRDFDLHLPVGKVLWQRVQKDCWLRTPGVHECLLSKGADKTDYNINRLFKISRDRLPTYPQAEDLFFVLHNDAAAGDLPSGKSVNMVVKIYDSVYFEPGVRLFPNEIEFMVPYFSGLINYVVQAHLPSYKWMLVKTNQPKQTKS
jgi:hypothetical protein